MVKAQASAFRLPAMSTTTSCSTTIYVQCSSAPDIWTASLRRLLISYGCVNRSLNRRNSHRSRACCCQGGSLSSMRSIGHAHGKKGGLRENALCLGIVDTPIKQRFPRQNTRLQIQTLVRLHSHRTSDMPKGQTSPVTNERNQYSPFSRRPLDFFTAQNLNVAGRTVTWQQRNR